MLYIMLYILCQLVFVRERGAINLMLIWVQFIFYNKHFGLISKNFLSLGECHEATSGTSLTTCPFAAMLHIYYHCYSRSQIWPILSATLCVVTLLFCYIVCLMSIYSLPKTLYSLGQSLTSKY